MFWVSTIGVTTVAVSVKKTKIIFQLKPYSSWINRLCYPVHNSVYCIYCTGEYSVIDLLHNL